METKLMSRSLNSETISQESPQTAMKKSKKKRKGEKEKHDGNTVQVQNGEPPIIDQPVEDLPLNVKTEVIYDRTDKTPPIVGYFPSGYDPLKDNNEKNQPMAALSQPNIRFYRNAQRVKIEKSSENNEKWRSSERLELVVSPPGSNVEFVGRSYKGEAMTAQSCSYALAVLDKETQTLKIMPIAGNKIFRLEPKLRGSGRTDNEPSEVENVEFSEESRADKRREATILYGSKKSIQQDKKLNALKLGDNPEAEQDLSQKINFAHVRKEALESTSAHVARNIPPHNTSASTPQEAYPLDKIILSGEWYYLEDIFEVLHAGAEVTNSAYPTFVCNRIHKLQEIQDEVERKIQSCIFSYINHLIKFKDMHSLDGASSAKNHRFPSIVRQRFLDIFSPESRRLSVEKVDLLISYVLVLALYADDFRTDPADIAKDLRMSLITLRSHFENLGCKLVRDDKKLLATLPVPLQFPKLRQKRRR